MRLPLAKYLTYGFLLMFFFAGTGLRGQSNSRIIGRVYDAETGNPLSGAVVRVSGTYFGATSDEDGFFIIENLPPGEYQLQVFLLGYASRRLNRVIVNEDQPYKLQIALTPSPLPGDSVQVLANSLFDLAGVEGEKVIISGEEIRRYRSLGLNRLLEQVAGVQVESPGGTGSRILVRIHGSKASQVLVLLDGQRLNDPQTGEVDLSAISLNQIERIEVIRQGNSAIFGGSAFDGVIAFVSKKAEKGSAVWAESRLGSFSSIAGNTGAEKQFGNGGMLLNYRQDYSRQDFPYRYEGETKIRRNAWTQNRNFFGKIYFDTPRQQFSLLLNSHRGRRGLPSAYFDEQISYNSEEFNARLEESVRAVQLRHLYVFSSRGYLESQFAYHYLYQLYNNEDAPLKQRYKSEQTNGTLQAQITARFKVNHSFEFRLGASYLKEMLDQKNLLSPRFSIGKKVRDSRAMFGSVQIMLPVPARFLASARLHSALRYEKYFRQEPSFYPLLGLSLVPRFSPAIKISLNWARAVRYPDFNSLFWKGDVRARGNPDLLPERKTTRNIGVRFVPAGTYLPELSAFYFRENVYDLIFWHRNFEGVWEPRNEERFVKSGWDLEWRQNLLERHVRFQAGYSFIRTQNKKRDAILYDKKLVFVPEHTVNIALWAGWKGWQSQLIYRYVSDRETTPNNTEGARLEAYQVWDVSVGYQKSFGKILLNVAAAVKNIAGENYQLILGYPMPGRAYQLTVSLKYQTISI